MTTRPSRLSFSVLQIAATPIVLLFGFVASLGDPLLALLLAAPVLSLALAARPLWMFWSVLVGGLVVAGVTELYVPMLRQARWGVVLAAVFLAVVTIFARAMARSKPTTSPSAMPRPRSNLLVWALAFFVFSVFSSLLNDGLSLDSLIGLKGYFQVWGLLVAFIFLPMTMTTAQRTMVFLLWIGLLQLPFALHESLFLAPQRLTLALATRNIVAEDIVVGTFAGSMNGGGAGPSMTVLLGVTMTVFLARWRTGQTTTSRLAAVWLTCLVPIALGEHKIGMVFVILIPLLVYGDQLIRKPIRTLAFGILSIAIATALFLAFTMLPRATRSLTPGEYLQRSIDYNFGNKGYGSRALNRTSVYSFWWRTHELGGNPATTLVGYGPGSAQEGQSSLRAHSLANDRYPGYDIGLTGLSRLLWEVGVLGTAAVFGMLASACVLARRLGAGTPPASSRWPLLKGAEAGVVMIGIGLLHSDMLLFEIGQQTLLMVVLGYLWHVRQHPTEIAAPDHASA